MQKTKEKTKIGQGASKAQAALAALVLLAGVQACTLPPQSPAPEASPASPSPTPTVVPVISGELKKHITSLAGSSACAKYRWKDRSVMPQGAAKGLALSYARTLCRYKSPATTVAGQIGGATPGQVDALTIYKNDGLTPTDGPSRIKKMYALAYGFVMRESSGKYCEGIDQSASNNAADTTEAGPFQQSFNSRGFSTRLVPLWDEYTEFSERCDMDVWKEGVDPNAAACRPKVTGSALGHSFQRFTRVCPAFATEWALTVARLRADHFGPLKRHEAEYNTDCEKMLGQVEQAIEQKGCKEFL